MPRRAAVRVPRAGLVKSFGRGIRSSMAATMSFIRWPPAGARRRAGRRRWPCRRRRNRVVGEPLDRVEPDDRPVEHRRDAPANAQPPPMVDDVGAGRIELDDHASTRPHDPPDPVEQASGAAADADVAVGQQCTVPPSFAWYRREDVAPDGEGAAAAGLPDRLGRDVDAQRRDARAWPDPRPGDRDHSRCRACGPAPLEQQGSVGGIDGAGPSPQRHRPRDPGLVDELARASREQRIDGLDGVDDRSHRPSCVAPLGDGVDGSANREPGISSATTPASSQVSTSRRVRRSAVGVRAEPRGCAARWSTSTSPPSRVRTRPSRGGLRAATSHRPRPDRARSRGRRAVSAASARSSARSCGESMPTCTTPPPPSASRCALASRSPNVVPACGTTTSPARTARARRRERLGRGRR